ncbi:putative surface protein with fasciclin (FAS1) repeats [Mucilaginibacter yixingensis]|uniref:Putative surface protein with fasciclin (FAS1) repeats n=1 Tax=Mucilaginibacter yixingensis TaxID=1295612 RepID=A0A2T5JGX2_9SPHI|nr:fasciclin domain-containing protein [Mucilaginibacter yixingensis]PTR01669.1 putative surface protein with fasciclin (FAS1) repeats [Mucilaginibacter yixingensis]
MLIKHIKHLLLLLVVPAAIVSCNKYNKQIEPNQPELGENLEQLIQQNPQLSKFNEYLVKTGYDKVLSSSKMFTVWAPDNQTLAGLDAGIVSDTAKLKQFVGNHLVNLAYTTDMPNPSLRIQSLNGKYINFSKTQFEDATIVSANKYVSNGVLHTINKVVLPKPNVWEYVNTTTYAEKAAISSLDYTAIDSTKAVQIGIDPVTGKPVYQAGTGLITKNQLYDRVGDLRNEAQLYTFILLTDNALASERAKIKPYVVGATPAQTELTASLHVIKDLVIKGQYNVADLPATLTSADGVVVPIDKTAILETHVVSNGVVYVMSKADVKLSDKIRTYKREGELPDGFSQNDKSGNILYRTRINPNTNQIYNDIFIYNHKVPLFNVRYRIPELYAVKYQVYWVAPADATTQTVTFKQRFEINDPASTLFPEIPITLKNFNEVYIGDYTAATFGSAIAYVIAANNGVDGTNTINLDYFKLVPVLP